MQLSQSEPHHQPLAHRRGLLAHTHNLLWVTAARRILVAWKHGACMSPRIGEEPVSQTAPTVARSCAASACPA